MIDYNRYERTMPKIVAALIVMCLAAAGWVAVVEIVKAIIRAVH